MEDQGLELRRELTSRSAYVVFDVETTGLGPAARVVEFACLMITGKGTVVRGFDTLVNPQGPVGPTQLHGIDQAMVRQAPIFAEVAGLIEVSLRDHVHVGYNVNFDQRVLAREFRLAGTSFPRTHSGICAAEMVREELGRPLPLVDACEAYGFTLTTPHRAMADVRATTRLFAALGEAVPSRRPCPPFAGAWRLPPSGLLAPRSPDAYGAEQRSGLTWGGQGG